VLADHLAHRVGGVGVLVGGVEEGAPAELRPGQVVDDAGADRAQCVSRRRCGVDGDLEVGASVGVGAAQIGQDEVFLRGKCR
jgi:hypothetical protein